MLILTRLFGEALNIGDDIRLEFTGRSGAAGEVRITIWAPKEVPIHRKETYDRIQVQARLLSAAGNAVGDEPA